MVKRRIAAAAVALTAAVTLSGCTDTPRTESREEEAEIIVEEENSEEIIEESGVELTEPNENTEETEEKTAPEEEPAEPAGPSEPEMKTVLYIRVTADGVNIRSGAGTNYASLGTAEMNTLYEYLGKSGSWYKTVYRLKTVYISEKYCVLYEADAVEDRVENVISEGCKLLGTPYVYGAVRYHNGKGALLSGFTVNAFDCSSLMQYIFYKGADALIDVNTRTQIYQGVTVKKSGLKRGDLMFFTNDSRKNKTGIERVGHVALYLGDNLILHTASDYAKIEEISAKRWSYFIQGQRII